AEGPRRIALIGAGADQGWDVEAVRRFAGRAVRTAEGRELTQLSIVLPAGTLDAADAVQAAAEGALLAAWRFSELRREDVENEGAKADLRTIDLVIDPSQMAAAERGLAAGRAIAGGQNFARTLQSRPGNVATPTHLAEQAQAMARDVGLDVEVFGMERIRQERMHALLAVNQGSDEEARFIVLRHRGAGADDPWVALVGKGLTFDAGGISIKPAQG